MELVNLEINDLRYDVKKEIYDAIPKENIKIIKKYDEHNSEKNDNKITRESKISLLLTLNKFVNKPFNKMTANDIKKFVHQNPNIKEDSTKHHYLIQVRQFFRWFYGKPNPSIIKHLTNFKVKKKAKKWSEMLTEDEIQKIIDTYPDIQHKCLVAVLYDSACRVGEIVKLKRGDVKNYNGQWTISVDGKTGIRNVPLTLSTVYFEPWYNRYHPSKNDNKAPLFYSQSPRDKNKPIKDRKLSINAIWFILKQGEQASKIGKNLHPHLFRHSRLS